MRRVSHGITVLVCSAPHTVANSQPALCYIVGVKREKRSVSLKKTRTCGGMADVLIAARDWLLFT